MIAHSNPFHPYRPVDSAGSALQLLPPTRPKISLLILRSAPLLVLLIGAVLFTIQHDLFFLYLFGGIFLFEVLVLSFIRIPAGVAFDHTGFTLQTVSFTGTRETDYLWNDVDHIRHRRLRQKNAVLLVYDAVLKSGKKVRFLNFQDHRQKEPEIPAINEVLQQLSGLAVREK